MISSPGAARTRSIARRCSTALTAFLKAKNLKADWDGIDKAPNEALVNALSMMSPYGVAEKQALLEALDLKTRAEILVAITEMELAKRRRLQRNAAAIIRRARAHSISGDVPWPNRAASVDPETA